MLSSPSPLIPFSQHSWGIRLFIKEKDTKWAVGNTVDYSSFTVVVCSVFWNIDDFVTGVKFFSPAVSHFISDYIYNSHPTDYNKECPFACKGAEPYPSASGRYDRKMNLKEWKKEQWM